MSNITIKRKDNFKIIRTVRSGDVVLINNEPWLVSGSRKMRLICFSDGLVWSDEEIPEGCTEKGLKNYLKDHENDPIAVELIKNSEYEMIIKMK